MNFLPADAFAYEAARSISSEMVLLRQSS